MMDQEELPKIELIKESVTIKPMARDEAKSDDLWPFFTQALNLLCMVSFDGYFKRLNPMWTTRLGWNVKELEGMHYLDFVHPDDRETTRNKFAMLVNNGGGITIESRSRHQDASFHWLRWNAWLMPEHQSIYIIACDITGQKRQEREILEIADREKERLGLELHDGLCQNLAGIAALSSTLSKRLAAHSDTAASAAAAEIKQLLNESIHHARNLAHGLSPIGMNSIGLLGSLETLTLNVQERFRVSCTLACDLEFPRLHSEIEGHLFRIAQEAVTNAVTHGRPDCIEISLSIKGKQGLLSIRDNGVGMTENTGNSGGIGLHTMLYRARSIAGSLKVRQLRQRGMTVTCAFPITEILETPEDWDYARKKT